MQLCFRVVRQPEKLELQFGNKTPPRWWGFCFVIELLFNTILLMAEMSRRFNFDDFDEQIREALEDNAVEMGKLAARGLVVVPDSLMPPPAPPEPPDQAA